MLASPPVREGPDPQAIRHMFARVAHRYDLLNRLLSLRQDQRWRRFLRQQVMALAPQGPLLDLATGTGDVALGFSGVPVVGSDFCLEMLSLARHKGRARRAKVFWVAADALGLPFPPGSFAAVTVAFGLRNFPQRRQALEQAHRVLQREGVLGILEFHPVEKAWARWLHGFWQRAVVEPVGGWLSGDRHAYRYLPQSSQQFLTVRELALLAQEVGFVPLLHRPLGLGVAVLSLFRKGGGG